MILARAWRCEVSRPDRVEGQIAAVDQNAGRITVREKNGTTHEFQANRETRQDMKPGDQIEAKLREAQKCWRSSRVR
jgi:hypothetical protein